jgi:hypothetical protein
MASEQSKGSAAAKALPLSKSEITDKKPPTKSSVTKPSSAAQKHAAAKKRYEPAGTRGASGVREPVAANDDLPSIGGLIYALQQRPSSSAFYIALGATAIWLVLCGGITYAFFNNQLAGVSSFGELLANPTGFASVAAIVIPIALFWFLALLIWRAQELKLMASAMTEVAVRLAEPDRLAEQSVASVGQSVRRQVAAVNDAISRAMGRAGELEALLHNELATLERSYNENELRVRGLISELASERKALTNNSERVSESLQGIGAQVSKDIATASDQATKSLASATSNLAEKLTAKGDKITAAVSAAGMAVDNKLAQRGAQVAEQLVAQGRSVTKTLDDAGGAITKTLETAGTSVSKSIDSAGASVAKAMEQTTDKVNAKMSTNRNELFQSLNQVSERIEKRVPGLIQDLDREQSKLNSVISKAEEKINKLETSVAQHVSQLDKTLAQRTMGIQKMMSGQAQIIDETISKRSEVIRADLIERIQSLDTSLVENATTVQKSLAEHTNAYNKMLAEGTKSFRETSQQMSLHSNEALKSLGSQAGTLKDVSKSLIDQIHSLTQRFENQGQAILSAAQALDSSNARIDSILERRHAEISSLLDTVGTKARDLDKQMRSYSGLIENSLAQAEGRAKQLSAALAQETEAQSRKAVSEIERLRNDALAHTVKAAEEIKTGFETISGQVADQTSMLSQQFGATTDELRATANRTAGELETTRQEMQRRIQDMPQEARANIDSVRRQPMPSSLETLDANTLMSQEQDTQASVVPMTGTDGGPAFAPDFPQPQPTPLQPAQNEARRMPMAGPAMPQALASPADMGSVTSSLAERLTGAGQGENVSPQQLNPEPAAASQPESQPVMERRDDWSLGDLLARASEPETEPYPPAPGAGPGPAPEFLQRQAEQVQPQAQPPQAEPQSGSVLRLHDLANAIDHRTAAEVWQRYRQGERSVLDRQLYTSEGRTAFDEISQRYAQNGDFRATVDRYMGDFERLLKDAEAKDSDGRLIQNYLTSETGRVYLILAHASGRLH